VYAWGSISVECANSLMMMSVREKCLVFSLCLMSKYALLKFLFVILGLETAVPLQWMWDMQVRICYFVEVGTVWIQSM
jgi:hypothetical protein